MVIGPSGGNSILTDNHTRVVEGQQNYTWLMGSHLHKMAGRIKVWLMNKISGNVVNLYSINYDLEN